MTEASFCDVLVVGQSKVISTAFAARSALPQARKRHQCPLILGHCSGVVLRKNTRKRSLNPFYGYPAELIAEWCCVSFQSAEHYKAGRRKPSNRVLKLFRLQRDGKVLGDAWEDYRVVDERIFGPDGKSIRPTDIALWELIWQIAAESNREAYHELLDSLRRA